MPARKLGNENDLLSISLRTSGTARVEQVLFALVDKHAADPMELQEIDFEVHKRLKRG
jgi:hypothetical protein